MLRIALGIYLLAVVAAVAIAAQRPSAFQKYNTLRPTQSIPDLDRSNPAVDIEPIIAAIPYREPLRVWQVHPGAKYRETIVQGAGSCSQKSFGLAYYLDDRGLDYQIVHYLLPAKFMHGDGHTVIRLFYRHGEEEQVGLVDMLEGGLLRVSDRYMDVEDIGRGLLPDFEVVRLNAGLDGSLDYYDQLLEDAVLGYVPAAEVRRYFEFIERIYVPLGNAELEKYLYDGVALALGRLPRVFVPAYDDLLEGRAGRRTFYIALLRLIQSAFVLVPAIAVYELARLSIRRSRASS